MRELNRILAAVVFLAVSLAAIWTVEAQPASPCPPGNTPCACSFECCGQERCDGPICNQCVAACLKRTEPTNNQFTALRDQCQSMLKKGFRRL